MRSGNNSRRGVLQRGKGMANSEPDGGRFCAAYSTGSALDALSHELTPLRNTTQEVVADLLELRRLKRVIHFAQIIDMATLEPIEPPSATLARLHIH